MRIFDVNDFRRAIRSGAYAWPGGYPTFFVMSDGGALSFEAAKANRRPILEAIRAKDIRGEWFPYALEVNWEDATLTCDHSGKRIESAYAED